jgi:hypothetical protein
MVWTFTGAAVRTNDAGTDCVDRVGTDYIEVGMDYIDGVVRAKMVRTKLTKLIVYKQSWHDGTRNILDSI